MALLPVIIIVGAVVGVSYVVSALKTKDAGDKLKSDIDGLAYKGISGGKVLLDLTFRHANPTNKNLTFDFMFLDIFLGSEKLASIREENLNKKVVKSAVTKHVIRVEIPLTGLGFGVAKLILAGNIPDKVTITGEIKVNDFITEYNDMYPLTNPFAKK